MAADTRQQVLKALWAWLVTQRRPEITLGTLDEDLDLIAHRVIDSLQIVEFILLIEELSGRAVLSEDLDPDRLRTLSRVYATFFVEDPCRP